MKVLLTKLKESTISVLPITLLVLILCFVLGGINTENIIAFSVGAVMLIIGMTLFTVGADTAMVKIGQYIGSSLTKTKKLLVILTLAFAIGIIVTVAEPDLIVLAEQLKAAVNSYVLIMTVGVGVGIFLTLAFLRMVFKLKLRTLFIILYAITFALAFFVPKEFLSVAFDSGGVTTGPMTVPFIMAFGIGVASSIGGDNQDDSFGVIALCSVGPILAVMILGLFIDTSKLSAESFGAVSSIQGSIPMSFLSAMPEYFKEVAIALCPIFAFFLIYNAIKMRLPRKVIIRIIIGLLFVYIGLVLFLTGVNVGFSPVARQLGAAYIAGDKTWYLIPTGILLGFFIVVAEPAVHILNEQVEEISGGTIKKRAMLFSLMLGVGGALGLAMLRVITGVHILYILIPGYAIALILSFFVPKTYTAIAFDSGGVASGPLTTTFLLPFAIGAAGAKNANILTDAYGIVAFVAMVPLISIQLLGLAATLKVRRASKKLTSPVDDFKDSVVSLDDDTVVVFEQEKTVIRNNATTAETSEGENSDIEVIALLSEAKTLDVTNETDRASLLEVAADTVVKTTYEENGKNDSTEKSSGKENDELLKKDDNSSQEQPKA